jgi:hypothetical protein
MDDRDRGEPASNADSTAQLVDATTSDNLGLLHEHIRENTVMKA